MQHRLHLTRVWAVQPEVREQHDHAECSYTVVPAHSASSRAFTPVFDGLWMRVNALMLGTHIPETVVMGPRNGVPATHSASQTRVDALLLSRGAPRGDDRLKLAPSRRGGRAAPPRWTGDTGRYSRSFGLSASLASPPCGEWKAYRVTAAIARNSIESRLSHAASTSTIYHASPKRAGDANRHALNTVLRVPLENFSRWKRPGHTTSLQERTRSLIGL